MLSKSSGKATKKGILTSEFTRISGVKPRGGGEAHTLEFQFNPTAIEEKRGVQYNFSEGQGQIFPLAQYGRLEPIELDFELFFFNHGGLATELKSLRTLTLPRSVSRFEYYNQVQPNTYMLDLCGYGLFFGVVRSVQLKTDLYDKDNFVPKKLTAKLNFVCIDVGEKGSNIMLNDQHILGSPSSGKPS